MLLSIALALTLMSPADDCIGFVSENLAKGDSNFFEYYRFSNKELTIRQGDTLVYDVFLDPKNPVAKGGIDVDFAGSSSLRDRNLVDAAGLGAHGDTVLSAAVGKWLTRRIKLAGAEGLKATSWNLAFEGDPNGVYAEFVDNVIVEHSDGTQDVIYRDGLPTAKVLMSRSGYTLSPFCAAVDRAALSDVEAAKASVITSAKRFQVLDKARTDIEFVRKFVEANNDPALQGHVQEATALLDRVEANPAASTQEIEAALHTVQHALQHTHPAMEGYTGHLVGHAHIDLMWLWEWQEGIVASRDTFNQAVKFMDEFPGFTFSQSSSAIYKTVEENYPDLFKKIQQKVKKGQWELVGGRVDEGDTNMISPESHARHFLYGQRYFREKFGKTARVGWEPDTFGHTIQMPQILKLGGCDSYYFCRGGKEKPLFWWQGLDGTRMLSFDEPATGSWYNSDLSYQQFQEMLDFKKGVGSKDSLWVYGVGNHGGGPTREMIEEALSWMKDPSKPKIKFSTATEFFDKLRTYDLKKIPVITDELNPVFDGCYTTHSEVKQLNRAAEYATSSAEAVSTVASLFGFKYPKASFRLNWEDITFNHHHDTLPGSFIHPSSEKSVMMFNRVIADDKDIIQRAMETLTLRVTPKPGGLSLMVFNPTGWVRSGWVEAYAVGSGWSSNSVDPKNAVAEAPDGKTYDVELIDPVSRRVRFWAGDVPAFGYRVFRLTKRLIPRVQPGLTVHSDPSINMVDTPERPAIGNGLMGAAFDPKTGAIVRIAGSEGPITYGDNDVSLGRLEMHHEKPGGMSAWVLGQIDKVETLPVIETKRGDHWISFKHQVPSLNNPDKPTTVTQTFSILPNTNEINVTVDCDWQQIGNGSTGSNMLRVAFDTGLKGATATYEVPFGAISRPADGKEVVGLNWQDLSNIAGGLAILNDSKSGMSTDGSTMRLSLIRSSYEPDPQPNPGLHRWHYQIVPHSGNRHQAGIVKNGFELQQPMLVASVPFDARGDKPLEFSPLTISDPAVVATALKIAEDDNDMVLRVYQSTGVRSDGVVSFTNPVKSVSWVNFLEDTLGTAKVNKNLLAMPLRGYEIRTLKVR